MEVIVADNAGFCFGVKRAIKMANEAIDQNPSVKASRLVVTQAWVNGGPLLQGRLRFRPGPMGRAMPIRRRTCHIHVVVADPTVMAAAADDAQQAAAAADESSPAEVPGKGEE